MQAEVLAAYVTGLISGFFALVGFWFHWRQERQRTVLEEQREHIVWLRNALAESYSQAMYYLFKLSVSATTADRNDKDVRQHLSESQRYLLLLHAYHGDAMVRQRILSSVADLDDEKKPLAASATAGVTVVRELFTKDSRVNVTAAPTLP